MELINPEHLDLFPFVAKVKGQTESITVRDVEEDPQKYLGVLPSYLFNQAAYKKQLEVHEKSRQRKIAKSRQSVPLTENDRFVGDGKKKKALIEKEVASFDKKQKAARAKLKKSTTAKKGDPDANADSTKATAKK